MGYQEGDGEIEKEVLLSTDVEVLQVDALGVVGPGQVGEWMSPPVAALGAQFEGWTCQGRKSKARQNGGGKISTSKGKKEDDLLHLSLKRQE